MDAARNKSRPMDTVERRHVDRVMALGCAAHAMDGFNRPAEEYHHIRTGAGFGQRAGHLLGVGLCHACHQGDEGVHGAGTKGFAVIRGYSELDLLDHTLYRLALRA